MKRKKLKKIWIILLGIVLIVLAYCSFLVLPLIAKDYSFASSIKILKNNLRETVLKQNYNKTFESAINNNNFNIKYVENYFEIEYKNHKNFILNINALLSKGYLNSDINIINNKLSDNEISLLAEKDYIKDISKYLEFDFFKIKNLDRYIKYESDDYKEKIVHVNIGLDKEYYKEANLITNFDETVLANKYNKLDEKFEPSDIQKIKSECSIKDEHLSSVAKDAFEKMCDDAKLDKKYILANSAYRSYKQQQNVYNTYLNLYGKTYVNNYVATPGFSEHQTGLAIDVAAKGYNIFKTSPEYKWMLENAYKYGFILRYPEGKEKLTGYKSEAWHYRYVGLDAAKYIQENKITYDEYYVMFIEKN